MKERIFESAKVYALKDMVSYSDGATVSKIITRTDKGNLTLFAFDQGQNLSEHAAPFDAIVQVLDGKGKVFINQEAHILEAGQIIIMPANVPHAIEAEQRFKMLLIMIKSESQ